MWQERPYTHTYTLLYKILNTGCYERQWITENTVKWANKGEVWKERCACINLQVFIKHISVLDRATFILFLLKSVCNVQPGNTELQLHTVNAMELIFKLMGVLPILPTWVMERLQKKQSQLNTSSYCCLYIYRPTFTFLQQVCHCFTSNILRFSELSSAPPFY